jgi:hypothetical protein
MKLTTIVKVMPLALVLSGCWLKAVQVDGFSLYESRWNDAKAGLVRQAAFDLSCPSENLTLTVLNANHLADDVGAVGCGRQLRYTRVPQTERYVANATR